MLCFLIAFVRLLWLRKMPMACFTASNSHFDHGGSDASDMTTWSAICLSGCRSVRVGWRCFALLIRADAASLCARTRGEPSSAHCEQRLSERLTPCPCDPVCACTGMRGHAFLSPTPHAAQRAVPGWRGGLGRVGADLASAGSMRPPPSPARHVSTAWLATKHVRQETPRHHKRQAINNTPAQQRQ